ncbi:Serine/threonine-protein kinase DCLK1 [Trichinella pseudospiralis]|uniref:non-specific serine/threonine protein kinase n=1 Tax=Trichinella pseudospiralis TaxID=6337 RepID=A0A0V1ET02_TRIPS|nr:Serine/threonine-protein kinase DCLK1 [Trichinella pseudospiralis]KRY93832.1 Serine/threonine-protein kinase DCLK1 [Trichinella pseudospiralis]
MRSAGNVLKPTTCRRDVGAGLPTPARRCTRAKRVRFFRNGDQYFKGVWYALSEDRFRSFDALLEDLNRTLGDLVNLPHGVRCVFSVDGGQRILSLSDLDDGQSYVCSSNDAFKKIDYANVREPVWQYGFTKSGSKPSSLADVATSTGGGPQQPLTASASNSFVYPKIITVIRNGIKPRRVIRHLLNKRTARSYEQVLDELSVAVKLDSGAVKKLFTLSGKLVCHLADFFMEEDIFLACGSERMGVDDFYINSAELHNVLLPFRSRHADTARNRTGAKWNSNADRGAYLTNLNEKFLNSRKYQNRAIDKAKKAKLLQPNGQNQKDVDDDGLSSAVHTANKLPCISPVIDGLYSIGRLLGDGSFAVVYHCVERKSEENYAIKIIDKKKCKNKEDIIENEVRLLRKVSHPNIVRLYDSISAEDAHFLILEFVPGGDLFDALVSATTFTEPCASVLTRNLLSALEYLHELYIVHRDVKPENLLIYDYGNGWKYLKLADFGLATEISEPLFDICGTPTYVAPEMLSELGYGLKVDVWAAGVILFIMLCGYPPFVSISGAQEELFESILSGKYTFNKQYWSKISNAAKVLINGMLQLNADDRYSASEVLLHPWIQSGGEVDQDFERMSALAVECIEAEEAEHEKDNEEMKRYYSRRRSMDELSCIAQDVASNSFFS